MTKLFFALALGAFLVPTAAIAGPTEQRFTRDGTTYVYTVTDAAGGRQVIQGRRLPGGSAFRLVVTGTRVDGVSGGQPVSFRTPRASSVEVAAR